MAYRLNGVATVREMSDRERRLISEVVALEAKIEQAKEDFKSIARSANGFIRQKAHEGLKRLETYYEAGRGM